jgi:hypothetical protein
MTEWIQEDDTLVILILVDVYGKNIVNSFRRTRMDKKKSSQLQVSDASN